MNLRQTQTHVTLEVSPSSYLDIRYRLEKAGALSDYVQNHNEETEELVLGNIAIAPDFAAHGPFCWMKRKAKNEQRYLT